LAGLLLRVLLWLLIRVLLILAALLMLRLLVRLLTRLLLARARILVLLVHWNSWGFLHPTNGNVHRQRFVPADSERFPDKVPTPGFGSQSGL